MLDRVTATNQTRGLRTLHIGALSCTRWLSGMHQALVAHAWDRSDDLVDSPTTKSVLRSDREPAGILLAGGLDPQDAAWACDIFVMLG